MGMHKNLILFLLIFLFPNLFAQEKGWPPARKTKWVISKSSSLRVTGSTNMNAFACEISGCNQTDTLTLGQTDAAIGLSGTMDLDIQNFDCHNGMMTKDLRKTLKAAEFPILQISFLSLSEMPDLSATPVTVTGMVEVALAGSRKRYPVNYRVSKDAREVIHLEGIRFVKFSDFNLVPPSRLAGMVQTKDKLTIAFHLKMKGVN
jgi:hypothetical protein